MGVSVNAQVNLDSKYVQSVQKMSRIIRRRALTPYKMVNAIYYLTGDYRAEKRALKVLHDYTNSVIQRRKNELNDNNNYFAQTTWKKMAFLDLLIHATIDGKAMTDEEIREEVDTFMFEVV